MFIIRDSFQQNLSMLDILLAIIVMALTGVAAWFFAIRLPAPKSRKREKVKVPEAKEDADNEPSSPFANVNESGVLVSEPIPVSKKPVQCMTVLDSQIIAVSADHVVRVLRASDGRKLSQINLPKGSTEVDFLAAAGKWVFIYDGFARVCHAYRLEIGTLSFSHSFLVGNAPAIAQSMHAAWDEENHGLVALRMDSHEVLLYDAKTGALVHTVRNEKILVHGIAFLSKTSEIDLLLTTFDCDCSVVTCDNLDDKDAWTFARAKARRAGKNVLTNVHTSTGGTMVVSSEKGEVFVWQQSHLWQFENLEGFVCKPSQTGHIICCVKGREVVFVTETQRESFTAPWQVESFDWVEGAIIYRVQGHSNLYFVECKL